MIWTDWGSAPKIEKASLIGQQRVAIVTKEVYWPNGIDLDRGGKRVYWVDAGYVREELMYISTTFSHFRPKRKACKLEGIW